MVKKYKRIYVYEDDFWDLKREAAECKSNLIDYLSNIKKTTRREKKNGFSFP